MTNSRGRLPAGIDVRGSGGYVVLPPSPHPNGNYEWGSALDESPIAVAPQWLLDLLEPPNSNGHAPKVEGDIPAGQRDSTLMSMAGTMRRRGFSESAILAALIVENRDRCKPPLEDKQVRKIARSIARYKAESGVVASVGELTELLGLDAVGKRIDTIRVFGRGTSAKVCIFLDDGERLVLDPVGKFATSTKLASELALTTGASPKLNFEKVTRAFVLIKQMGQHHENIEQEDRAWELGAEYLRTTAVGEVVMGDQKSRWKAFVALDRSTTGIVLIDQDSGIRFVRVRWFDRFVREKTGSAELLREMGSLGWRKRGIEGQIKATEPGFNNTLKFRFFEIPQGWES